MRNEIWLRRGLQESCFTEDELYRYIALSSEGKKASQLESHLAECARCREELAGVLELLHPKSPDLARDFPEPSEAEIKDTVRLIQNSSGAEPALGSRRFPTHRRGSGSPNPYWIRHLGICPSARPVQSR